ncbi:MAG: ABC transporter substrate-binding protein [Dehalococcoidia bacterium]
MPESHGPPSTVRSRFTAMVIVFAATMVLLTGCGDDDASVSEPRAVEATISTTRVVTDSVGEVTVPVAPQRIVTFGPFATALLAVEAPVAGIAQLNPATMVPAIANRYEGIPTIGTRMEIDAEAVAALNPDLIVSTIPAGSAFDVGPLENIAPVLVFAPEDAAEWASLGEHIADAVGKSAVLKAQKTAYEARAKDIGMKYADVLNTVTFAAADGAANGSAWRRDFALGYMANALTPTGAKFPGQPSTGTEAGTEQLSLERLSDLNAVDVILVGANPDGTPTAAAQTLMAQPVWATLTPVRAGLAFALPWAIPRDYPTAMQTLDAFEQILNQIQQMRSR